MTAAAAATISANRNGKAFLEMVDGVITYEDYPDAPTFDENSSLDVRSGSKAMWSLPFQYLIHTRKLRGRHQKISSRIANWRSDGRFAGIDFHDVARLTSGLDDDFQNLNSQMVDNTFQYVRNYPARDPSPINNPSGTFFEYGPSNFFVFGAAIEGIVGDPYNWLNNTFLTPLGITVAGVSRDVAGNLVMSRGFQFTAREWVKWGEMLRKEALGQNAFIPRWRMNQLLGRRGGGPSLMVNPGHGDFIWTNAQGGQGTNANAEVAPPGSLGGFMHHAGFDPINLKTTTDIFGALGAGRNMLIIIPSRNAVIVRLCEEDQPIALSPNDLVSAYLAR